MKYFLGAMGIGISVIVLAGCQDSGTKFVVKDQRVPEQVGLKIDTIGDFGRDGILATQPLNIAQYYLDQGELSFRYFRVTNVSDKAFEIYPSETLSTEVSTAKILQNIEGICPRSEINCGGMTIPMFDPATMTSEYHSEFDQVGSEFRFDSGGRVKIEFDPATQNPRPVRFLPGESAIWVVHLRFHAGEGLIASAGLPPNIPWGKGSCFMPTEFPFPVPTTAVLWIQDRVEWLVGVRIEIHPSLSFFVRNPKTDELNPVYLGELSAAANFVSEGMTGVKNFQFPSPVVARRINGLAQVR